MHTETPVTIEALRRALKLGARNGQSVLELAFLLGTTERAVRKLSDELIEQGVAVCAHPTTGYYVAECAEEVQTTYDFLRNRAFHSLKKAKQLRAAFQPAVSSDELNAELIDYLNGATA